MTEAAIIEEFSYVWTTQLGEYVLVQNSQFLLGYIIVHKADRMMLLIEDNDAANYVVTQMLLHGCTVVTTIP